jgi:4-coumarate--CoA ligase
MVTARATTEAEVKMYLRTGLASYKGLDGGVVQLQALPRNANGKLQGRELKEMAKQDALSSSPKL